MTKYVICLCISLHVKFLYVTLSLLYTNFVSPNSVYYSWYQNTGGFKHAYCFSFIEWHVCDLHYVGLIDLGFVVKYMVHFGFGKKLFARN